MKIKIMITSFCIVLSAVFITTSNNVNAKDKDIIVYSEDRPLEWEDFRAEPDMNNSMGAKTTAGVLVEPEGDGYSVKAVFYKNKSWVKKERMLDNVLKHEQGHFDIVEIFARKLRKYIVENPSLNIEKKYDELYNETTRVHSSYDRETNHDRNDASQKKWNKKLYKELESLSDFK